MSTINKLAGFWDNQATIYDERAKIYEQNYLKSIKKSKKYLGPGNIVLDYACGTGIIATGIAKFVKEVTAIDISLKMIEVAKGKADEQNIKNISFAQVSIFDKKFTSSMFNVILVFNVLHLVKDTPKIMQRLYELLKPGGMLISGTPCMGEKITASGILIFLKIKLGMVPYMHYFKASRLEKILGNAKFQIIETEMFFNQPSSYYIAAKKIN
jgi:2-polyprenyl-3-methyl-5-hydroxy-6-metoxy-1,4-benzoquinol methylase